MKIHKEQTDFLFLVSLGFRVVFLFSIPSLSNDFYRFVWDGRLIWEGLNPYLYLPEFDAGLVAEGDLLYRGMGEMNGSHFTCYPPINQFSFLIPALFFAKNLLGSVVVMRLLIILADVGTYFFAKKIATYFSVSKNSILLYFLNPFVIIELTGNLHFEGVMVFFLAGALYFLFEKRSIMSAVFFAISVAVKLIPLLFLPLFYKKLGLLKTMSYSIIVVVLNVLFFLPFLSNELVSNFMSSIHLYFQNFEFNASLYYLVREIGYFVKGYNVIQSVGKITPFLVIIFITVLSLVNKNQRKKVLVLSMLFGIVFYYFVASVVHPWYIAIPLFLCIFSRYRFPVVWSFIIVLSYSAYQSISYDENLHLVFVEYLVVYSCMIYEVFWLKNQKVKGVIK